MAQHDYVIDNSTGANVRADINNALLAISSNNSGSSAPSTTYALQTFANTTTSRLQLRNAANNAYVDLRGFDGSIILPDGSNSACSLSFDGDPDTGVFRSAGNKFNVATGGIERMELGTTTIFNEDGEDVDFRIEGDNEANLFLIDAGDDNIGIATGSPNSNFKLDVNGAVRFGNTTDGIIIENSTSSAAVSNACRIHRNGATGQLNLTAGTTTARDMIFNTKTNAGESMRLDSSGRLLIGKTSGSFALDVGAGSSSTLRLTNTLESSHGSHDAKIVAGGTYYQNPTIVGREIKFRTFNTSATEGERVRIDSSGRVLIGLTANAANASIDDLQVGNPNSNNQSGITIGSNDEGAIAFANNGDARAGSITYNMGSDAFIFKTDGQNERMRIDSSGRLLIGLTSSATTDSNAHSKLQAVTTAGPNVFLGRDDSDTADNSRLGVINFGGNHGGTYHEIVTIRAAADAQHASNSKASRLELYTTSSGNTQASERMRISSDGDFMFGQTTQRPAEFNTPDGLSIRGDTKGQIQNTVSGQNCLFNRKGSDGAIIGFRQDGSDEGSISVSGSTVSYNGGHLSRWSQLKGISTTDKSARPTIYQGTVMSNLDELCEWKHDDILYQEDVLYTDADTIPDGKKVGDVKHAKGSVFRAAHTEQNQQLNMTKISDTEGEKDVAGVFWAWDDDDDEIVNDFYVAMTGDMVIRVAASTTVARGDLLISAGDGTAKPQDDDIVRSSTIAKIISTNHTATYADGSKAYPCVLMAC